MADTTELSTAELEAQLLDWPTNLSTEWEDPKETKTPEETKPVVAPTEDPPTTTDPAKTDGWTTKDPETDPPKVEETTDPNEEKPKTKDNVKKLLSQRNAARDEVKEYKKELDTANERIKKILAWDDDEEFDNDADRDLALIDAKQDAKLIERDIKKVEKKMDTDRTSELSDFMSDNPDLKDLETEIETFAKENPNLSMNHIRKIVLSDSDPLKLVDQQTKNKMKGWFDAWWKTVTTATSNKSVDDMSTAELEAELENQFTEWKL